MKSYLSVAAIDRLTRPEVTHTGAMIALVPSDLDARRVLVEGGEPLSEIHMTMAFLGSGDEWSDVERAELVGRMATVAKNYEPITGRVWAAAHFNPTGPQPAAVYLIGGPELDPCHTAIWRGLNAVGGPKAPNFTPWVAHVTAGYHMGPERLTQATGWEMTFDRLRIVFAGDETDIGFSS